MIQKRFIFPILLILFLTGCANSGVSRNAANNVDSVANTTKNMFSGTDDVNVADSYQNASQTTKGALIGGAVGGVTGALSSTIGVLPGIAGGALIGASYGAYIDANTSLQDRLENRGATIVVLGDQMLIIVPSSRIFKPMSPEIKTQGYSTVSLVAQFINCFAKTLVKVSSYTSDTCSKRVDLALSKQQAASFARALQVYGVNARMLYAEGYGGTHLVEGNSTDWDHSQNYRIEITFEKLKVY